MSVVVVAERLGALTHFSISGVKVVKKRDRSDSIYPTQSHETHRGQTAPQLCSQPPARPS